MLIKVLILLISFSLYSNLLLFEYWPSLKSKIKYVKLSSLPTPIYQARNLQEYLNFPNLFIKRDDRSSDLYGGNKTRKLEFLLADAVFKGSKKVVTVGGIGSNHAVATTTYARILGLKSKIIMMPQPVTEFVKLNLQLNLINGAKLIFCKNRQERDSKLERYKKPSSYIIPVGGSNPIGILGFINAAFELHQQIKKGEILEPDYVYIPMGSFGTIVGLLIGFNVLNLKTKIVAVSIEKENKSNNFLKNIRNFYNETVSYLLSLDSSLSASELDLSKIVIRYCDEEYGQVTKEAIFAKKLALKHENIILDITYSSKALAVLIQDIKSGKLKKENTVLFWNTYSGKNPNEVKNLDYSLLPKELKKYFEDLNEDF